MKLLETWIANVRHRATIRTLRGLDAHTLRDIGIDDPSSFRGVDQYRRDNLTRRA